MKIKPYEETHMEGLIEVNPGHDEVPYYINGDIGIEICEDGRIWLCIHGVSFLRFKPTNKYVTEGSKLRGANDTRNDAR